MKTFPYLCTALSLWMVLVPTMAGALPSEALSDTTGLVQPMAVQDTLERIAPVPAPDVSPDTSLMALPDTLMLQDSIPSVTDTVAISRKKSSGLNEIVDYQAADSISFSLTRQTAAFYHEGDITYGDVHVTADTIRMELDRKLIHAWGGVDSLGHAFGDPVFTQGAESFNTKSFSYNYDTKRGTIKTLKTQQGESYLHAEQSKRFENGDIHMKDGDMTTCDADHPHFQLHARRAKSMPGNKIVFGYSYLVVEDVPLYLIGLPFGLIPETQKQSVAGLIPPSFGIESTRGMALTNGGYYHPFGDVADAEITGDYYTGGTWGLNLSSRYLVRYRFSGNLRLRYYVNVSGEKGINESESVDYSINWSHTQDAKANPYRSFSASVNFSTSKFEKNQNYVDAAALMTNTKTSSISYRRNWPNSPFHLTVNANHSQNSNTEMVNLILPSATFSVDRIYPFKRKVAVGSAKWYENISLTYSAEMKNSLAAKEKELFTPQSFDKMQNGFSHSIPLSINFKILKLFNITPSLSYKGVLYTQKIEKHYDWDVNSDTYGKVQTDTIRGLVYGHSVNPSLSVSFTPKFYLTGTMKNQQARLQAIRYVLAPSISMSYVPDVSDIMPNYYRTYQDSTGRVFRYSQFEGGIYGTPSFPSQNGNISFSVNNNVEMKVRSLRDSTAAVQKVKLFERLSLSTSYNMFADSMNWSNISWSTSFRLTKKINLDVRGTLDPYCISSSGQRYNRLELLENHRLGRLTSASFGTSYTLSSDMFGQKTTTDPSKDPAKSDTPDASKATQPLTNPNTPASAMADGPYHYFDVPWSISFNYSFNYSKSGIRKATISQSLSCSGSIKLTAKWDTSFSSGYDFEAHEITHTSFNIARNLHCWQMTMSFSPFGMYKFYAFKINANSSMLRDLKYDQKKDRRDYQSW